MKFLPTQHYTSPKEQYSGIPYVELYIENTKQTLDEQHLVICLNSNTNLPTSQYKALEKLRKAHTKITIKPADKHLGLVLMDTDDYIAQCMAQLADTATYRPTPEYPMKDIRRQLQNNVLKFSHTHNKQLHRFLAEGPRQPQILWHSQNTQTLLHSTASQSSPTAIHPCPTSLSSSTMSFNHWHKPSPTIYTNLLRSLSHYKIFKFPTTLYWSQLMTKVSTLPPPNQNAYKIYVIGFEKRAHFAQN